jgi:hypothetical protein
VNAPGIKPRAPELDSTKGIRPQASATGSGKELFSICLTPEESSHLAAALAEVNAGVRNESERVTLEEWARSALRDQANRALSPGCSNRLENAINKARAMIRMLGEDYVRRHSDGQDRLPPTIDEAAACGVDRLSDDVCEGLDAALQAFYHYASGLPEIKQRRAA